MTTKKKTRKTAPKLQAAASPEALPLLAGLVFASEMAAIYASLETLGAALLAVLDRLDRLESPK